MTETSQVSIDFAAITDIGCARTNNEDSYGYDVEQHLYVVCDGMGGRVAGEVASGIAVRTLIESFGSSMPRDAVGEPIPISNRLMQAVFDANHAVREAGAQQPALRTMGTTLVCVCLDGENAVIGNVGDSRAYLIRGGFCRQVTQDHSLLSEAVRAGDISPESAGESGLQSVITREIGVEDSVQPDFYAAQLEAGDVLLLASDGLTRYTRPDEILAAVEGSADLASACQALIDHAKTSGGADNITCLLLRLVKKPIQAEPDSGNGSRQSAQSERPPDEMDAFTATI